MYRPERINKDEVKRLIAALLSTPVVIDSDLFLSIMNGIEPLRANKLRSEQAH